MSNPQGRGVTNENFSPPGLFSSLRTLSTTLLATLRTRLELIGNDIEFERLRLVRSLLLGLGAAFCLGVGILLLVGLVLALQWESRVVVLAILGGGFTVAGIFLCIAMQKCNAGRHAFSSTLAELEEDIRQLRASAQHGQTRD